MPISQPAKLLRILFSERDRHQGRPLHEAIVDKCMEVGAAGATVMRGLEGFGETAEIHKAHLTANDRPIVIMIVDTAENVERLIGELRPMTAAGFMAVSDVMMERIQRG